jgi:hypothetical protein
MILLLGQLPAIIYLSSAPSPKKETVSHWLGDLVKTP